MLHFFARHGWRKYAIDLPVGFHVVAVFPEANGKSCKIRRAQRGGFRDFRPDHRHAQNVGRLMAMAEYALATDVKREPARGRIVTRDVAVALAGAAAACGAAAVREWVTAPLVRVATRARPLATALLPPHATPAPHAPRSRRSALRPAGPPR